MKNPKLYIGKLYDDQWDHLVQINNICQTIYFERSHHLTKLCRYMAETMFTNKYFRLLVSANFGKLICSMYWTLNIFLNGTSLT